MRNTALATIHTEGDTLSPSEKFHIPSIDDGMAMSAAELHKNMLASLVGFIVCYETAKNLVAAAKRRMQDGELVGGCLFFCGVDGYIDRYLKQPGQSLEAAKRATYRMLDGLGVDVKHDGTEARDARKKAAQEKAKRIADKKVNTAADKAARLKYDTAAAKSKSLKDKTYIETLEAKIDMLEKTPSQAEATARPIPVQDIPKSPVNDKCAAQDARDLDTAIIILQAVVHAVTEDEKETALKTAFNFLRHKSASRSPSEEAYAAAIKLVKPSHLKYKMGGVL